MKTESNITEATIKTGDHLPQGAKFLRWELTSGQDEPANFADIVEGYHPDNYFRDGRYLGPDVAGVEPVWSIPAPTDPTPAQLLPAAREGKITATVIDAETLPALAGGDGPDQYPSCTIALQIDTGEPDLTSLLALPGVIGAEPVPDLRGAGAVPASRRISVICMTSAAHTLLSVLPGKTIESTAIGGAAHTDIVIELAKDIPTKRRTLREIRAWKLVYYSTNGDTLNSGRGTYDFRAVYSDGCTRGDVICIHDDSDGEELREIIIKTGEGMQPVYVLSMHGLSESEVDEVLAAISGAIDEAYSEWTPEHPEESEIYAALTATRGEIHHHEEARLTATIGDDEIAVRVYAGTHCGQPQFAYGGDESETVYEDAEKCAKAARERLEWLYEESDAKGLLPDADTSHDDAEEWYGSYGAHTNTEHHGDLTHDAVDFEWLDGDDSEAAQSLKESYTELSDDEAESMVALARRIRTAAEEVTSLLDDAVTAYEAGDLDACKEALDDASRAESDHGDDPASKSLRKALFGKPELDTASLDKQEREAADALEASLRDDE